MSGSPLTKQPDALDQDASTDSQCGTAVSGMKTPARRPYHNHELAANRRVAMLTVHHVQVGNQRYHGGAEKYIRLAIEALLEAGASVHVGFSGTSIYDDLQLAARGESENSVPETPFLTTKTTGETPVPQFYHGLLEDKPGRLTIERTDWINDALAGDARLSPATILHRRRWLRATGADTVFCVQQAGGGAFAASILAAKSLGLRIVSSVRQMPQELPTTTGKRWLGLIPTPQLWRRRLIWRKRIPAMCCDSVIFNSRRVARLYEQEYGFPADRSRIIPNGEVTGKYRQRALPDRPSRIASVGRVTHAKGADTLLDAFTAIAQRHPHAHLAYYGDGPLMSELDDRARSRGLGDRVDFHGFTPDHEAIYPDIDIYVQASRRESMSNSVIEAMARGIPCVVSDVGGLPETVDEGRTGFVVPANQPERYAEALDRLLSDRQTFARFSDAAIERVRSNFDLAAILRRTVETVLGLTTSQPADH